jgi:hypothetical protein
MIRGKQIGLRAIEFKDLDKLLEWRNKPEFRRFFRENRELNWDQQKAWYFDKVMKDPNTRMFSIVRLADNALLGACGLCYIDWVNGSADFSIYIGHEDRYIDVEYAPDAAQVLIDHAFREIRVHRVWAEVYSFDADKQTLLQNLGFQVEGTHRETCWQHGAWHDSVFFSLLDREN